MKSSICAAALGLLALSGFGPVNAAELTATYTGQFVYLELDGTFAEYTVLRSPQGMSAYETLEYNETGCTSQCTYKDYRFPVGSFDYKIEVLLADGTALEFGPTPIDLPAEVALAMGSRATPNPIDTRTKIRFNIPAAIAQESTAATVITIHDPTGREVDRIFENELAVGAYEVVWDAEDRQGRELPSGSYFYRIQAGPHSEVGRMVLLK